VTTSLAPNRPAKDAGAQPHGTKRKPNRKKPSDWIILATAIVVGLLIAVPFLMILINSFKSPADYNTGGPLQLPTHLYFDGIVNFWNRVAFPQKLWNSIFISGMVSILAIIISVLNAYALGIGRVKARLWIIVLFLLANMVPQEALLYPLYSMFKAVGLYDNVWSVIIIFTVIQSAFGTTSCPASTEPSPKRCLRNLPQRDTGGGGPRRREPVDDTVARDRADQPPDAECAPDLLLHLDLERVPDSLDLPGEQQQPDRACGDQRPSGRPAHGCHDDQRIGAARPASDPHLLPHLPAHTHARHHRWRGQVAARATPRKAKQ